MRAMALCLLCLSEQFHGWVVLLEFDMPCGTSPCTASPHELHIGTCTTQSHIRPPAGWW